MKKGNAEKLYKSAEGDLPSYAQGWDPDPKAHDGAPEMVTGDDAFTDGGISRNVRREAYLMGRRGASKDEVDHKLELSTAKDQNDYVFGGDYSSVWAAYDAGKKKAPFPADQVGEEKGEQTPDNETGEQPAAMPPAGMMKP